MKEFEVIAEITITYAVTVTLKASNESRAEEQAELLLENWNPLEKQTEDITVDDQSETNIDIIEVNEL